jgi:hypothetical protein
LSARLAALLASPERVQAMGTAARNHVSAIASLSGAVERLAAVLRACERREWPRSHRGEP